MAADKAKNMTDSDPATAQAPGTEKAGEQAVEPKAPPTEPLPEPPESPGPPPEEPPKRGFTRAYWMCNTIEMFERLAYFGIRGVVPIYIMQATEPGGLHLTAMHKGIIYAWWAFFQSFLPIVTGGFADRYGYKRVLFFAISANTVGYIMMAFMHTYMGFFAGILVLATGTAFFKPALQGTIAQNLTKANSSVGWGIFYWVVNVGAFGAPIFATIILGRPHSAEGWRNLFLASAAYTFCNLFLLLTFKDVPSGASKTENPFQVFWKTIANILDLRLLTWLLIMSCFWLMMYQLWDLHPNFIEDWVDSSGMAKALKWSSVGWEYGDRGLMRVPQQLVLTAYNALLIVALMVPISWLVRRMRTLSCMLIGMLIATCGVLVAGLTPSGWILALGITCFSLGEMMTGPKKNEYLGLIAPPGKKGLYLGYVNIPVGVGVFFGSYLAGYVYDNYGEKASLALKHLGSQPQLVAHAAQASDWSDSLELLPGLLDIERGEALAIATQDMGRDTAMATKALQDDFRYDAGQVTNLGLMYLALDPTHADKVRAVLAQQMAEKLKDGESQQLADRLAKAEVGLSQIGLGRYVHLLPKVVDVKRPQVFETVRHRVNNRLEVAEKMEDAAIIAMLWNRFGDDPETLNNLALEYLAQNTGRLLAAVAPMSFPNPVEEIPEELGIDRTKSFAALSGALAADVPQLEVALSTLTGDVPDSSDRAFVYLAQIEHQRYLAVARQDWTRDIAFLREMVESDDDALAVLQSARGIQGKPSAEDFALMADDHDLVQEALRAKNWAASPQHAAHLLGLNPFEARVQAASEVSRSRVAATKLLWDTYDPQYKVWIPFSAIGFVAAIALLIFGRMAKRWKDMNA
jgi:POT family proton-dependent oligopeptide transporter